MFRTVKRCLSRPYWVPLASALIFLIAACATVPITGRSQLKLLSDEELCRSSNQEFCDFVTFAREKKIILSPGDSPEAAKILDMVNRVSDRIFEVAGLKYKYPMEVVVVKAREANAFVTPGGKVVVFTGLLPIVKSEAGLAAVIGHEVGHVVAHHANERSSQQLLAGFAIEAVDVALAVSSYTRYRPLITTVTELGLTYGLLLPFSREHELEADRLGQLFMAKAGYDPEEAIHVWELLQARSEHDPWEFLSTHPCDETRIAQLRERLPEAMTVYVDREQPLPLTAFELQKAREERARMIATAPIAPRPSFLQGYWWRCRRSDGTLIRYTYARTEACGGSTCYVLESDEGTELLSEDYAIVEVRLRDGRRSKCSPPMKFVDWPLRVGAVHEEKVTISMGGKVTTIRFKGQIIAYESITTQAGTFMGYKIVGSANGVPFRESWYVPELRNEVRVSSRTGIFKWASMDLIDYQKTDEPVVEAEWGK